jgi:hypothetical protein
MKDVKRQNADFYRKIEPRMARFKKLIIHPHKGLTWTTIKAKIIEEGNFYYKSMDGFAFQKKMFIEWIDETSYEQLELFQ